MARPDGPGSCPSDQAPTGLAASRGDPSRVHRPRTLSFHMTDAAYTYLDHEARRRKTSKAAILRETLNKGQAAKRDELALERMREAVESLCYQFAHNTTFNKSAALTTGGLSALEEAFDVLGWDDPHRTPELTCDEPKCWKRATCGKPVETGYRRVCGDHYRALCDTDGSPKGQDAKRLDGEAATAGAEGIAR